jgi:hypothetical protein
MVHGIHSSQPSVSLQTSFQFLLQHLHLHLPDPQGIRGSLGEHLGDLEEQLDCASASEKVLVEKLEYVEEELSRERKFSIELNQEMKLLQDSLAHLDQKQQDALKILGPQLT